MKIDYKLIGKRIQNRRKEMGYSQIDFAEKIDRSTTFVSYIENGTRSMTINTLIQIANVLDVSSDYLLADYIGVLDSQADQEVILLLPINENHTQINAEAALADPDSVFHYYRKLIELRKEYEVFRHGRFELLMPEDEKIFAYTRDTEDEHLLVVCNFTGETLNYEIPQRFNGSELLIGNYATEEPGLRPYEAAMLYYKD